MRILRGIAALGASVLVLAGCAGTTASPSMYKAVPIGPTAWPSGTTGHAGALPVTEDPGSESVILDDAGAATTLDRYVAASAGEIGDPDWLKIAVVHFKTESQTGDVYSAWVDQYAAGACSQANDVSGTDQQQIGDFTVDISTCAGGLTVYTFQRGDWIVVSMYEFGPKHLGKALIAATY